MANEFSMVEFDTEDKTPSSKSGTMMVKLGDLLGCQHVRARVWYLDPGESMTYHKQREQEELYVPIEEDGQLQIESKIIDVPRGAAVRVPPETPRQLINEDEQQHVWLVIGAPPVEDDGVPIDPE